MRLPRHRRPRRRRHRYQCSFSLMCSTFGADSLSSEQFLEIMLNTNYF